MLQIMPCDFKTAQCFVKDHHRHNKPPVGHKFSIACYDGDRLCGVAMVGRPVGRYLDDGLTLEVNRCCTDGTRNACSMLYGAAWRAAKPSAISEYLHTLGNQKMVPVSAPQIGNEQKSFCQDKEE